MSTPRIRLLVAAGAATALGLIGAAPASAATVATTTDPAVGAAGWLAQQFRDASGTVSATGDHLVYPGSTYYYSGLTADAVFGLAATHTAREKIDSALAYIASQVASDTNLDGGYGTQGPYDGSVAKAALAAIVGGADPTAFGGQNLMQALKDGECTAATGSAADYQNLYCPATGSGRNVLSSIAESFVILAESRAGAPYLPSADAVSFFTGLQCPDGGFTGDTAPGAPCSSGVDETAYGLFALTALPGTLLADRDARIASAAQWLRDHRSGGYWPAGGPANVDSTGLATAALDSVGDDVSASRAWLAAQQVTDGPSIGIGATRGALKFDGAFDADASVKATADGLLGLATGGSLATVSAAGATPGFQVLAPVSNATRTSLTAGGKQTVSASGFAAGEKVSAVLHSTPVSLGTVTATANGDVSLTFTVPADLAAGTHSVEFTGLTSGLTASVSFTVAAPAAAPSTGPSSGSPQPAAPAAEGADALANSGLDGRAALQLTLLGVALVVAGGGAVVAGRRRA